MSRLVGVEVRMCLYFSKTKFSNNVICLFAFIGVYRLDLKKPGKCGSSLGSTLLLRLRKWGL